MNDDIDSAIASLRVESGDPITRKLWNGLLDLCAGMVKSFSEFSSGTGVRIHRYPQGINVVADRGSSSFGGAFGVRVAGMEATVGLGTVEDVTPSIGGARIDDETIPKLKIDGGPNEQLRSWIAVKVTVDPEAPDAKIDPEDPESLQIIHTNDLSSSSPSLLLSASSSSALLPLAMLIWSDTKTISRVRQIVFFNQRHRFTRATQTATARHTFWAAA